MDDDYNKTYKIIGICMEVHRVLGKGFTEPVYQDALEIELRNNNVAYSREQELDVRYKGEKLAHTYRVDFLCYDDILVELKAVKDLTDEHRAQVINYLKATGKRLALLINFGKQELQFERFKN